MKRTLSDASTPLLKFVSLIGAPAILIVGLVITLANSSIDRDLSSICGYLISGLGIFALFYLSSARLKEVSVDDDNLYVSNYIKEISIPLSQICGVTENGWKPYAVTIYLSSPTIFGDKIRFIPRRRLFSFVRSHAVADEIKTLAKSKGASIP